MQFPQKDSVCSFKAFRDASSAVVTSEGLREAVILLHSHGG